MGEPSKNKHLTDITPGLLHSADTMRADLVLLSQPRRPMNWLSVTDRDIYINYPQVSLSNTYSYVAMISS